MSKKRNIFFWEVVECKKQKGNTPVNYIWLGLAQIRGFKVIP